MVDRRADREFAARDGRASAGFRRWLLVAGIAGATLFAVPAGSANLVQIRVGNHPSYTRVVFEFDAPTGYRIERRAEGEAAGAILVTLDAQSRERNIASVSRGVESVSVEADASHAVARIVARVPGLPIREMIYTDPPRIVLDLLLPEAAPKAAAAVAETPPPEPEPEATTGSTVAEPMPEVSETPVVTHSDLSDPASDSDTSEIGSDIAHSEAAGETAIEVAQPEVADEADLAAAHLHEALNAEELAEALPGASAEATEPLDLLAAMTADPADASGSDLATEAPGATDRGETPSALPLPEAEAAAAQFDFMFVGMIALAILALGTLGLLVMRSRPSKSESMDVTALAADDDEAASEVASQTADHDQFPDGGFTMGTTGDEPHAGEDFELGFVETEEDENKPIAASDMVAASAPGPIHDSSQPEEAMMMENQDLPTTMDSEASTQLGANVVAAAAVADSDVAKLLQEFERRMGHMEARLDEANEARERLERQVEAQNEELRVQRAAIARTQRALRSLNRSEEDQATEPALRNPSTSAS